MSSKRYFYCDLCGSDIQVGGGVGVYHEASGKIVDKSLLQEGCGHHLCNKCIKGLKEMFAVMEKAEAARSGI